MNKKSLLIIILLIVIIGGAVGYVLVARNMHVPQERAPQENQESTIPSVTEESQTTASVKGSYIPYSPEALASAPGTRLIFFYAPWCPQCRAIDKSIIEQGVPDNVTILKVDYDTNQELRQKYGVTLQTTFVKVDKEGNKLASYTAYEEPNFDAVKRELLP